MESTRKIQMQVMDKTEKYINSVEGDPQMAILMPMIQDLRSKIKEALVDGDQDTKMQDIQMNME